jgi:ParB-like chromosome segregation protein Spo0J
MTAHTTTIKPTGKCHPACLLLPEMSEEDYRELVEDIRVHGQREMIHYAADTGDILDGRHRWRACKELGKDPWVYPFHGTEEEQIALIISANIKRRHLTIQQRAAVAADLAEKLAEAAAERERAGKPGRSCRQG